MREKQTKSGEKSNHQDQYTTVLKPCNVLLTSKNLCCGIAAIRRVTGHHAGSNRWLAALSEHSQPTGSCRRRTTVAGERHLVLVIPVAAMASAAGSSRGRTMVMRSKPPQRAILELFIWLRNRPVAACGRSLSSRHGCFPRIDFVSATVHEETMSCVSVQPKRPVLVTDSEPTTASTRYLANHTIACSPHIKAPPPAPKAQNVRSC